MLGVFSLIVPNWSIAIERKLLLDSWQSWMLARRAGSQKREFTRRSSCYRPSAVKLLLNPRSGERSYGKFESAKKNGREI